MGPLIFFFNFLKFQKKTSSPKFTENGFISSSLEIAFFVGFFESEQTRRSSSSSSLSTSSSSPSDSEKQIF